MLSLELMYPGPKRAPTSATQHRVGITYYIHNPIVHKARSVVVLSSQPIYNMNPSLWEMAPSLGREVNK